MGPGNHASAALIPGHDRFRSLPERPRPQGRPGRGQEVIGGLRPAERLRDQHRLPRRAAKEKATAEAFQQALSRVGIKLTLKPYPQGDYFAQYCGNPPYVVKNKLGLCLNACRPTGLMASASCPRSSTRGVIRETGGSSNMSVRIPEVDQMLDKALTELDTDKRNQMWGEIDKRVMEEAVIYPGVYAKDLLVRSKNATNIMVTDAFGEYDYLGMGAVSRSKRSLRPEPVEGRFDRAQRA